jgi:hypothetical protein
MAQGNRHVGRYQALAAFLIYLALSIVLFGRGLPGHLATEYIGRDADPSIYMWYLRWWRYAIDNRINPFLTDLVWAPQGFNMAWAAFIPLPAWIVFPIGSLLGDAVAYNVLSIVALPLSAASAFLLCRRVTGTFWPSILGGYIFGFSSYMLSELLGGHLNLTLAFAVPLAALVGLRRLDGEISARRFTLELAIVLVVEFLCGIEVFATMTVFAGFAMLTAIACFDGETRARLIGLIVNVLAAYAIAMVAVSPYLYYLFALGAPHGPGWPLEHFPGDLLNFVVPTETNLLGTFKFARTLTDHFRADLYENGVYLGIPLIVVMEAYRRMAWRTRVGRFLIAMLAITIIASFGTIFTVAGRGLFPMPWALFGMLPVISGALPVRLAIYSSLVVSIIAAIWFSSAPVSALTKCIAAFAVVLFLAPNLSAPFWLKSIDVPAFFTNGAYAKEIEPHEIVLPVPFPRDGKGMYWQARADMYFRMAAGWTITSPFEFVRMPAVNYLFGEIDLPEVADQLKAYIARFGVRALIANEAEKKFPIWQQTFASLGVPAVSQDGVWIYKIAPDAFAEYGKLPGGYVEARANALRFDAILEAGAKYLADGHDLAKLSPDELKRVDLLPHDWLVEPKYTDWDIGQAPGGRVAIVIFGSYDGVKPLMDRYRAIASEIDYPAPTRWTPQSSPPQDRLGTLLIAFDRARFEAAAGQLKSSPPPERTTPFLAADPRL